MRIQKYVASLILMAVMAGPLVLGASALTRSRDDDDRDHKVHRYYDRKHRDYHEWNERESRSYVRWETENHRRHREFERRHRSEQTVYWTWRHNHPDRD